MSGEHFAVAVPAVLPGGAVGLAELLRSATAEPVALSHAVVSVGARVGIATSGTGGDHADAAELLRRADAALAAARADGRQVAVFEPSMDSGRTERLALLGDLHRALDEGRLDVHFQPKLDLATGRVRAVEALCRWEHPVLGPITPSVFVPVAESAGLVDRLTDLVLATALQRAREWEEQGLDLVVAVNLSTRSLDDTGLPERVAAAVARAGVRPDRLVLEITETSVMGDPARTLPVLHALAALGVGLSLDDFGTGYSSLAYLQRLPVHELKIDRSFVIALEDPTAARQRGAGAEHPRPGRRARAVRGGGGRGVRAGDGDPARARLRARPGLPRLAAGPRVGRARGGPRRRRRPGLGHRPAAAVPPPGLARRGHRARPAIAAVSPATMEA